MMKRLIYEYEIAKLEAEIEEGITRLLHLFEYEVLKYKSKGKNEPKELKIFYPIGFRNGIKGKYFYAVDKVRYYISILSGIFDISFISHILLKPYYITNGEFELVSLFSEKSKSLVFLSAS